MYILPVIPVFPYIFLLLRIFISLLKIKPFTIKADPQTFVSVIVACHNEQKSLPLLLKNISKQDYPADLLEVIVIDDNSTDYTFEIASSFKDIKNIITLRNTGQGKKQAIRTGVNASSGRLIITTDADCRMGKRWIRTIAAYYEEHKPDMIICPVQLEPVPGFFGKFQELEFLSLQGVTAGTCLAGEATICNGANLSFTRKAYLNNSENLHDEINSGDDIFLLHAIKKEKGSEILWLESADALITSASSPTVGTFLKQRSRWISKGKAYSDQSTIILATITFLTFLAELSTFIAGFFDHAFIPVFLTIFLFKSIPDFLILNNASKRYARKKLMIWFLPAQIIYPFYVMSVVCYSLISNPKQPN
jgi:cellulose synthase/poly-beta-1,6-N-acetylglucosamine synthase-like glycosyltransferase